MARNIIDLPTLGDDGKLYRDTAVDMVESLIPNPWESCHAPDLLELENGDLLCCWFAGSREGNADISIAVARLPADAEQWEQPVIVSDDPTRSEQNPSLFQNPNGDIWLMYTAQAAKKPDDNSDDSLQGTAEIRRKISRDGGRTWGPTEAMFTRPGSFCRQKIQVLSNGRWIFNNFICALDGTRLGSDVTVIQISDDQGKTWRGVEVPESRGRVHGNIIELEPGKLVCLLRSRAADHIYRSESNDNGETWSVPVPTPLRKCLQQAVKERLLVYNPCDAVTLPSGEKPEVVVFTNDQQRALVQASYRHRYGVFIRLDLCTGLRMGELLALKWEDIDFSTAQLHVRRTINRLAKYEAHDGENKTEIVFGTPKTKNSRRTIPLTRTMVDELTRWKQQQAQDKQRAGDKYTDEGFIVTNEFGHYFEQKTFKDYYDRLLKDADIGHFTFHALRHTFATRALERGMDYKTLSAILGHYSVAFTMDTYVHSMDEHKRREMDKMNDMFGVQYSISVENQPYPVLCTLSADGCTAHVPDFPKVTTQAPTLDAALLEVKQQIQKALRQYKNPPIPTKQDQIVVPTNSVLVLVKAG